GGWPRGVLTEIHLPLEGIGELRVLLPALARLSREDRWIVFIAPPYIPYAPALAAGGVELSRLLLVHPKTRADHLWAVESSLRSGFYFRDAQSPIRPRPYVCGSPPPEKIPSIYTFQSAAAAGRSAPCVWR